MLKQKEYRRMVVWLEKTFTDEVSFLDGEAGSTVYLWHKPVAYWDDGEMIVIDSEFARQVVRMFQTWSVYRGEE